MKTDYQNFIGRFLVSMAQIVRHYLMNRKWNRLTDEQRKAAKEDLIYFFECERDEQIGVIAADRLLDFFLEHVGKNLYNKGIEDAKKALEKRLDEVKYDFDELLDL